MNTNKLWEYADIAEAGGKQHWANEMRLAAAEIQRLHAVDNAARNVCHAVGTKVIQKRLAALINVCDLGT